SVIHPKDDELISKTHNTSRFCVENPQITWVLLIGTVIWGIYGYSHMPQRKDPDIPPKQAMVITPWPGASAEKVEELVTRSVEKTIASNSNVSRIESVSRSHVSTVTFTLSNRLKETGQVLDDIGGRLDTAKDIRILDGPGFVGIDGEAAVDDKTALDFLHAFLAERYGTMDMHPDAWEPFVVRDPSEVPVKLVAVAGEKYSYREMDDFTDTMEKALLATARTPDGPPLVAKVVRSGILPEKIYLFYSQQRLASYGLKSE